MVSHLVGIAIERDALSGMAASSPYGGTSQTVQDRINELDQQRQTLKDLASQEVGLFQKMSEQDIVSYWDRWRAFGYESTLRWAIAKIWATTGRQPVLGWNG